jgi:hypothetical protein
MATKKKAPAASSEPAAPALSIADLLADGANPRQISAEAAAALGKSLAKFGDLSGIVWNRRTGELVTGHQRMDQIRAQWPDVQMELPPADGPLDSNGEQRGYLRVAPGQAFALRVVDWTKEKQRLANVTANNQKLQGTFTDELSNYLLEIEAATEEQFPGALDELLLAGFIEPAPERPELVPISPQKPPAMAWVLIGVPTVQFGKLASLIDALEADDEVLIETTVGNGLDGD